MAGDDEERADRERTENDAGDVREHTRLVGDQGRKHMSHKSFPPSISSTETGTRPSTEGSEETIQCKEAAGRGEG